MDTTYLDFYTTCPNCQAPLGRDSMHAKCPECEFVYYFNPAPCVSILIANEDHSQLLFGKRKIDPFAGSWDVVGGFVDPGESAAEATLREVKEETNLEVEIIKQLGDTIPDWYGFGPTLCFPFLVRIKSGTMTPQDDVAELKWFAIDQLPQDIPFENANIMIKRYLEEYHA